MKKIILVTGASSGMGTEFARQLAHNRQADEIWLVARRKERIKLLAQEIENTCIIKTKILAEDISGSSAYQKFKSLFKQEFELSTKDEGFVIDTLVNNAGFGTYGPFAETPIDKQLSMVEINVNSLTAICGAALPYLQKGSRILNVASLAAYIPLGNFAVYAATKSYVLSFTLALAAELKDFGIKVMALCPGPVSTEFAQVASNGARKEVLKGKPADRVVSHALKKLDKNHHTAIMSLKWKFKAFMSHFVGRYFFARYTYLNEKRPYNHSS